MASNAAVLRSVPDLKLTVFYESCRGLPSPLGLLRPKGTGMISVPLATAAAQNHMSSVVGAIAVKRSSSIISIFSERGGYSTPPTPVCMLRNP